MMKVSLIITTYNRVHLLRKTYTSILHQSFQPDELIISDDGSSEDIIEGIKDLIEQSEFKVKFVEQEDKGFRLAKCRNNGAREATGDFLVFFDQDLLFSKHYLEAMVNAAKPNRFVVGNPIRLSKPQSESITKEMIIEGDYTPILTESQRKSMIAQYRKERLYSVLKTLKLRRLGPKLRGGISGFYKKDFIKVNGYDEKFLGWGNEDDDLCERFYAAGIKGHNPFVAEYGLHLYHKRFHEGERVNRQYQKRRVKEIHKHDFKCTDGYLLKDDLEEITVKIFNT